MPASPHLAAPAAIHCPPSVTQGGRQRWRGWLLAPGLAVALLGAAVAPAGAAARREWLMGTAAEIRVYDAWPAGKVESAIEAAFAEFRTIDRLMAVQRPESDVSRLNREGASGPVAVDARVIEVLLAAERASVLTAGAFDVTVLPVVEAWGFLEGEAHRPRRAPARPAGWQALRTDPAAATVAFTHEGVGVDLGGIAKGYALDRARAILLRRGVTSAYLDLGGNVATIGLPPDAAAWRIGIRHPRRPGELLGVVEIGEGAIATSGDGERFIEDAQGRVGHVFDPRTGRPATALASATIVAASATMADALSTAAVVLGEAGLRPVLDRLGGEALLARRHDDGVLALQASAGLVFQPAPLGHDERRMP